MTSSAPEITTKHRRRDYDRFRLYIGEVVKQVHEGHVGLTSSGFGVVEGFLVYVATRYGAVITELLSLSGHDTITALDVQVATRLILPGDVGKHAISLGSRAVTSYASVHDEVVKGITAAVPFAHRAPASSKGGRKAGAVHASSFDAGLVFPIRRSGRLLAAHVPNARRMGVHARVYFAAVLEYLTQELTELAGKVSRGHKKTRIVPRHLMLAIRNDEELDALLPEDRVVLPGGVVPSIHSALLPTKSSKGPA